MSARKEVVARAMGYEIDAASPPDGRRVVREARMRVMAARSASYPAPVRSACRTYAEYVAGRADAATAKREAIAEAEQRLSDTLDAWEGVQ